MSDRRQAAAHRPGATNGVTPPGPAADRERILLLECRLEEMRASVDAARSEADLARTRLADAAAREAAHARRFSALHDELAAARSEIVTLHRHLERVQALRARVDGYLFEGGRREDAEELVRLRRAVLAEDQRALLSERTVGRLRARVEELVSSRETLLTRVAEWQRLIRHDGPEAADLAEFLAELLREILDLEHRASMSDTREARLRERLSLAGIDPDRVLDPTSPDEPVDFSTDDPEETGAREDLDEGVAFDARAEDAVEAVRPAAEPVADAATEVAAHRPVESDTAAHVPSRPESTERVDAAEAIDAAEAVAAEEPVGAAAPVGAADTAPAEEPLLAEDFGEAAPAEEPLLGEVLVEAAAVEEPVVVDEAIEAAVEEPVEAKVDVNPPAAARRPILRPRRRESADGAPAPAGPLFGTPARSSTLTAGLLTELERTDRPTVRAELLLRLGRTGDPAAPAAIRPWTEAPEPSVRAAAYEALSRLLEKDPEALEPHLRNGIADKDPRVRRRVALATATARGLEIRSLLAPLDKDPDPQVRRVVRQVLRRIPPVATGPAHADGLETPSLTNRALGAHK